MVGRGKKQTPIHQTPIHHWSGITFDSGMMLAVKRIIGTVALSAAFGLCACAENGYEAWLRYRPLAPGERLEECRRLLRRVVADESSDGVKAARDELVRGISGLVGKAVVVGQGSIQGGDSG